MTALSRSAPIELNTPTDNQMRSDVSDALLHRETQRRPQESRIEKARPLTWIKGAAGRGITVRHHPRRDRERDMSKDAKPAQKRIDQFFSGPGEAGRRLA